MQIKDRIFPYPVLNNNHVFSSFKSESFSLNYEAVEDESNYTLKGLTFATESKTINSLFKEGRIGICLIVECSDTVYRKKFELTEKPKDIVLKKVVMKLFEKDPKYKIFYDPNCFTSLRSINCKGDDRRTGSEVIFWGMNNSIPFPQANDINKVITLVQAGDEIIENKEKAKEVINVGTPRQVSYYLSALQYLKYLGQNKKLTERALKLKNSKSELVSDIYNQLLEDKLFGKAYHDFKVTGKVNIDKVTSDLKKESQRLSESTLRRRASTIRSWVEWMYGIDKVNEMNALF